VSEAATTHVSISSNSLLKFFLVFTRFVSQSRFRNPVADPGLVSGGGAKVECHSREDPGTEGAEAVVCAGRGLGRWLYPSHTCTPPQKFFSHWGV